MKVESICLGELATNCYLLHINGRIVVIDPAEPSDSLFAFVGKRKVDMVINTHGHFDHIGGDWALKEQGAQLLLHRADLPCVEAFYPDHPPIDRYLQEGDIIADGLKVLHVPGHSPGSVILVGDGVLFSGDLLFAGSVGRTDFPGGSIKAMKMSLRRIFSLFGDCQVYPGHGEPTTLEKERRTNPFILNLR
jgi:glyoxylase-like metal-dependent hydrolase (beta-lactamase superfamily II)